MADTPVLTFEVYRGAAFLFREDLSFESITIGKGPAAMLRIENDALHDLHLVVNVNENGTVQLLDLVGEGTKVNGQPVVNATLNDGDEIAVGDVRIVVKLPNAFSDEEATQMVRPPKMDDDEATDHGGQKAAAKAAAAAAGAAPAAAAAPAVEATPEDVMAFVMRSVTAQSEVGVDRAKPPVLEVAEIWGDVVVDIKQFGKGGKPITAGSSSGYKWTYFGMPVAYIPDALAGFTWILGPGWSNAEEQWKNDFFAPADLLPNADFNLFTWEGAAWAINVSDKWTGFVDEGETRKTLQELIESGKARKSGGLYKVEIGNDSRVVVDLGGVIFFAHMVPAGKKVISKLSDNLDWTFWAIMSATLFLGISFAVLVYISPPSSDSKTNEIDEKYVEMLVEKPEEEEEKKSGKQDAGEGAKAKKEEGKVGKKDAKMEKAKGNKVEMNQQQIDKQVAENAGLMGAMREGSELDSMLGASGLSSSVTGGIGGLIGANGTQMGSGGLGGRGTGLGGGGTAEGMGGLGTKGRGSGASGYGEGGGNFGDKQEGGISKIGGDPIILGALDKALIDEVIKRNMNQIRYCYQRELTKNPDLGGKIVVKFVIAKDGTVSSATTKATTMNNSAVESCINGRFMKFKFPEPKGGGIVIVSYPFLFSPG